MAVDLGALRNQSKTTKHHARCAHVLEGREAIFIDFRSIVSGAAPNAGMPSA